MPLELIFLTGIKRKKADLYKMLLMTVYQYNSLTESQKVETLWLHGDLIADRPHPLEEKQFLLYSLFNFHVEVEYNRSENTIEGVRSFFSVSPLEPYLENIDISAIFK